MSVVRLVNWLESLNTGKGINYWRMMEKQVSVSVIVSKGHSRPLAEVSYVRDGDDDRSLLISACHDKQPQIRNGETGDWIGTFHGHKGAVWSAKVT